MNELGKLVQVDPRLVWKHEAHEFTPWLLTNADRLAEALKIELELESAEHAVGGYSLDLVGRDMTNGAVLIVENQLATTDHTHLGQVLTYAAGTGASTIVWIATAFREEHRQALDWLNESTGDKTHFFGIELQVVKIAPSDDKAPLVDQLKHMAPLFNVVAQPNDWQKQVRAAAQAGTLSGKGALYVDFWDRFIDRVHAEHPDWTKARAVGPRNWYEMKSLLKGCRFSFSFAQGDRLRHELYIDSGDGERNAELFEHLTTLRAQIESGYGGPLAWEELPNKKASRVADYKDACNVAETERYDEFIDWFIDCNTRLRGALSGVTLPT